MEQGHWMAICWSMILLFPWIVYTNLYVTLDSTADLAAQSDAYTTAANDAKAVMEREGTAILKQRVERKLQMHRNS